MAEDDAQDEQVLEAVQQLVEKATSLINEGKPGEALRLLGLARAAMRDARYKVSVTLQ